MNIQTCSFCDIGLEREINQDCIFCGADGSHILAAVADGMGGHENGEAASGIICENLKEWWRKYRSAESHLSFPETVQALENVIEGCNARIFGSVPENVISGSTIVLLWIDGERWALLSAGDSRCYLMKRGIFREQLRRLSVDDVWENQKEIKRRYSFMERKAHPNYGSLTKAVGADIHISCQKREGRLKSKSVFLLCSDGVYRYCEETTLKRALKDMTAGKNMKLCLDSICQSVYQKGAPDNISAIAVSVQ